MVKNPHGKIKPSLTIVSGPKGEPVLTDLTGDFSNSNFKYKTLTATGLDMLLHLTEILKTAMLPYMTAVCS